MTRRRRPRRLLSTLPPTHEDGESGRREKAHYTMQAPTQAFWPPHVSVVTHDLPPAANHVLLTVAGQVGDDGEDGNDADGDGDLVGGRHALR